jgi:tripartite-type tricarboxylate transporter receptor subunit TctC
MAGVAEYLATLAVAMAVFSYTSPARADDYPSRPVTVIVPYAPGGATDIIGRFVAQKMGERMGVRFVVENRAGAGTLIGAGATVRAAPDGYTLLLATSTTLAINQWIYKKLPYDAAKDFVPVALVASVPFALLVNPSLPATTVGELVALAKAKPGQLSYGHAGAGSPPHLYAELLKSMTATSIEGVAYKGEGPALVDLIAGHIPIAFATISSSFALIASGRVRALGISSANRAAAAPQLAPLADSVPGYEASAWQMIVAPAGTPREIVSKLNSEINAMVKAAENSEHLGEIGLIPIGEGNSEQLAQFVRSETLRWAKIVDQAGIAGTQ